MGITPSNNNRQMEELYRRQILQHTERGFAESSVAQSTERTTRGSEKNRARSWRYRGVSMHCHLFSLEETFVVSAPVTATSSSLSGTGECSSATPMTSNSSSSITYPQDTEARERTFSWRKIEVIDIRQPHDIRIHFEGLSCARDRWIHLVEDLRILAPINFLSSAQILNGTPLDDAQLKESRYILLHGKNGQAIRKKENVHRLDKNILNDLKKIKSKKNAISTTDFSIGEKVEILSLLTDSKIDNSEEIWREAKVTMIKYNNIRIHFLGWDNQWDTNIDISKDGDRIRKSKVFVPNIRKRNLLKNGCLSRQCNNGNRVVSVNTIHGMINFHDTLSAIIESGETPSWNNSPEVSRRISEKLLQIQSDGKPSVRSSQDTEDEKKSSLPSLAPSNTNCGTTMNATSNSSSHLNVISELNYNMNASQRDIIENNSKNISKSKNKAEEKSDLHLKNNEFNINDIEYSSINDEKCGNSDNRIDKRGGTNNDNTVFCKTNTKKQMSKIESNNERERNDDNDNSSHTVTDNYPDKNEVNKLNITKKIPLTTLNGNNKVSKNTEVCQINTNNVYRSVTHGNGVGIVNSEFCHDTTARTFLHPECAGLSDTLERSERDDKATKKYPPLPLPSKERKQRNNLNSSGSSNLNVNLNYDSSSDESSDNQESAILRSINIFLSSLIEREKEKDRNKNRESFVDFDVENLRGKEEKEKEKEKDREKGRKKDITNYKKIRKTTEIDGEKIGKNTKFSSKCDNTEMIQSSVSKIDENDDQYDSEEDLEMLNIRINTIDNSKNSDGDDVDDEENRTDKQLCGAFEKLVKELKAKM